MSKPRLIYDGTCPICTNYVRLIKKKISPDMLDFFPNTGGMNEFEYVNKANQIFRGNEAIDTLVKEFPQILDYMWMLPANYKVAGLKVAYAVGSAVRKVITKGCNCGKK